jgi:hypothetical protein
MCIRHHAFFIEKKDVLKIAERGGKGCKIYKWVEFFRVVYRVNGLNKNDEIGNADFKF